MGKHSERQAGQIKNLTRVHSHLWEELYDPTRDMHAKVALLLKTSLQIDDLTHIHQEFRMPPHIGREMFSATCLYSQLETSLANWHGIKVFNVTQKSHIRPGPTTSNTVLSTWC